MIRYLNRLRYGGIGLVGVLSCLMMGCGQSGPLYLPDQEPPVKVPKVFASKTKAL